MRRARGRMRRGGRRSVAWIPGYSTVDVAGGTSAVPQALGAVPGSANTYGFGVNLIAQADLAMHGGEDAVVVRILGTLTFFGQQTMAAGPVPTFSRVMLTQVDTTGDAQLVREYVSSAALGYDDILWCATVGVAGTNLLAAAEPLYGGLSSLGTVHIDCKAKRKIQADRELFLQYQCVTALVPTVVQVAGHIRVLLMRPR